MASAPISEKEVLDQLDECTENFVFPMLDNGYIFPITQRLSCYRDEHRWAMIIECFEFNVRAGEQDGVNNCLHVYGNCLDREPGIRNEDFIYVTDDPPEGPVFEDCFVRPVARSIMIRSNIVPFDISKSALAEKGVNVADERVTAADLLRSLLNEYREQFLATEAELRARIPEDLPLILRLDEWYHPDVANDERPSENETFQMLAKVLATGDVSQFKPSKEPNTHWSNWPDAGTL